MAGTYNDAWATYNDPTVLYDGTPVSDIYLAPRYQVQVFAFDAGFGIGDMVADLANVKNIGWADYVNDVPEAFFTLNQDDPQIADLASYLGKAHVRILRGDRVVWAGWLLESDETDDDVVFQCYGYLAGLFWLLSDWNQEFTTATVRHIIETLWTRAKTTLTETNLAFVTTGIIEGPVTTSDGSTQIVMPLHQNFYKRILFAFQELVALALSDTTNTVVFEITHSTTPTFNLFKDRSRDRNIRWSYGGDIIAGYRRRRSATFRRNDLKGVGNTPHSTLLRKEASDATDITEYGRRQEPIFLSWVRDETELERINKLRLNLATRDDVALVVDIHPNKVVPPGGAGARFRMTDTILIDIENGMTDIGSRFMAVGWQTYVLTNGSEHLSVLFQEPRG